VGGSVAGAGVAAAEYATCATATWYRYLVRLIDDATSWSWGRFFERDATVFNMAVLWEY
jgi:hypothetical protein